MQTKMFTLYYKLYKTITNCINCVIHTCIGEDICNKISRSAIYVYINDDDLDVKDRTRILFSLT